MRRDEARFGCLFRKRSTDLSVEMPITSRDEPRVTLHQQAPRRVRGIGPDPGPRSIGPGTPRTHAAICLHLSRSLYIEGDPDTGL